MDCSTFLKALANYGAEKLPQKYIQHTEGCHSCAKILIEEKRFARLLQSAHSLELEDKFWNEYLAEMISKIRAEPVPAEKTIGYIWRKRLLIPVAAGLVAVAGLFIADNYYHLFNSLFKTEEVYYSTLDFIWSEHELASSQYVLDSSPINAVDEIILENWEVAPVVKK